MSQENITMRKRRVNLSLKDSEDDSFISSQSDVRSKSVPDLSTYCNELEEMQAEIKMFKNLLESANQEIDKLILENQILKTKITELEDKIKTLNKIYCTPISKNKKMKTSTLKKSARKNTKFLFTPVQEPANSSITDLGLKQDPNPCTTAEFINECCSERKIYILGGQQCVNLASYLIRSRSHSKFGEFKITSWTKPFASTEEILKKCYKLEDLESSLFILCVGENDSNPIKIFAETAAVLKQFKQSKVLILNVNYNRYLNEKMLNSMIKQLCNNTVNCNFIETLGRSREQYLINACYKINSFLDSQFYEEKYITNIKTLIWDHCKIRKCPIQLQHKIGTIPYYFSKIQNKNDQLNKENKQNTSSTLNFFRS